MEARHVGSAVLIEQTDQDGEWPTRVMFPIPPWMEHLYDRCSACKCGNGALEELHTISCSRPGTADKIYAVRNVTP